MIAATTIKTYIAELVSAFRKIDLMNFLREIQAQFYPNQDLSFMDYFLELCDEEKEGQFVVPHEKLIEFGVATSKMSADIKTRIERLGLIKDEDYRLRRTSEPVAQGGFVTKNSYFLTPDAFKKCLMRAKKEKAQLKDVSQYASYFLFVEKVANYYTKYQRDLERAFSVNKDGQINALRDELVSNQDRHAQELAEAMRQMDLRAERQRAEILGETKEARSEATNARTEATAAKEEVKKAREDISDLHETVIEQHETHMNMAQHASVDVAPAKRQYFAMTACRRVGDTSGRLYFTTWRRQAVKMTSLLVAAMTNSSTDKNDNEYTQHHLVIPPIYFPGAVNLGNAGKAKLDSFVKNKLAELNNGRKRGEKIKIKEFKDSIGLTSSSLHPVWTPNEYMSHCRFVDCFLAVIKETKIIKMSTAEPTLQKQIETKEREQFQSLINITGEAREALEEMIENVRAAIATPPSSDDEATDREDSE